MGQNAPMARASSLPVLRGQGPVIAALMVIAAVVVVDILIAADRVAVTSLMIAAPLLCGITASAAATLRIGILSVLAAALAFIWGPRPATSRYWIPLGVVAVGSAFPQLLVNNLQTGAQVGDQPLDFRQFRHFPSMRRIAGMRRMAGREKMG